MSIARQLAEFSVGLKYEDLPSEVIHEVKRYMYDSNSFIINYKSCNMGDLSIKSEHIGLCQSVDDGYKIFKMYNDFTTNKTNLTVFKDSTDLWAMVNSGIPFYGANATDLSLPIIKFSSREETTERLSKLIVFS